MYVCVCVYACMLYDVSHSKITNIIKGYVYMYVCMYMCVCMYVYVCVCVCMCMYAI
jgi:hypothetical protein